MTKDDESDILKCDLPFNNEFTRGLALTLDQGFPLDEKDTVAKIINGDGAAEDAVDTDDAEADFNFLYVTEHRKASKFKYARCWQQCLHCSYRTRKHQLLTKHMLNMHADRMNAIPDSSFCTTLDKNSESKVMSMSEYRSSLSVKPRARRPRPTKADVVGVYACAQCGKVFSRLRYLKKHHQTHRNENKHGHKSYKGTLVARKKQTKKIVKCNQCPFVSTISAVIRAHRQIHSQNCVKCDICGNVYNDRSTMKKHKRVHDLNRPYACTFPGCNWRFKTEIMCKAHIRAHTTEAKFRCSHCGYTFRHKHHLLRHETRMHGVKTGGKSDRKNRAAKRKERNVAAHISDISEIHPYVTHFDCAAENSDADHHLPSELLPVQDLHNPSSLSVSLTSELTSDLDHSHLIGDTSEMINNYDVVDLMNVDYALL